MGERLSNLPGRKLKQREDGGKERGITERVGTEDLPVYRKRPLSGT